YEEADPAFFVGIGKTHSRRFVVISAGDHVTSEARLIEAAEPEAAPRLVAPRVPGQEYDLEHRGERFYLRVNDTHRNFRVVTAPLDAPGRESWQELIPGGERHYIQHVTCFKDFLMIEERVDGLDQVRLRDYGDSPGDSPKEHCVAFPEASYAAGLGDTPEFDVATVRLGYTSMVTPATVYDYDVAARKLATLKVQEIPSGYDKARYVTERLMAPTADGKQVPISLVYRDDFPKHGPGDDQKGGPGPLHLYGYGAYGMGMSPAFSTARLSLLDRGFAYAIAHIRGGDELGYGWYEDGKLMRRENTFSDFEAAARHLIAAGYAAPGRISIQGGSAGGTLVGVMANRHPEMWRAVLAQVPFVDVLYTMLDDSLPLTPIEWPEWGNPAAVTGGLTDPRVTYWEPAKWAARLRALKTDGNLLVLKTNMGAGHGGKSGRYEALHETAEEYTFLLMAFGKG
ncbi:MAG: S9 family peptidase, partial [Planctomycetota bacterium]